MISRANIKALIDETEARYRECWGTHCALKRLDGSADADLSEAMLDFQPTLARALFDLSEKYRALHQERRDVVAKKERLSAGWFRHRMRTLDRYQRVIKPAISLGRRLGDAFAWPFYGEEGELLLEHYNHQRQPHMPPGVGGLGELKFIENFRLINGYLVLYHGTTSFLTVGDISLISLKDMSVAAVGELKTTQIAEDELSIVVSTVGPNKEAVFLLGNLRAEQGSTNNTPSPLQHPQSMRVRLDRQVTEMVGTFGPSDPDERLFIESSSHINELNALCQELKTSSFTYKKLGDGCLLAGIRIAKRSFAKRLVEGSRANWNEKLRGFEEEVQRIVRKGSDDNELWLGLLYGSELEYRLTPGMVPLFWWPIDLDVIEALHFHDVLLLSAYNPAHLAAKLRSAGFEVESMKGQPRLRVEKRLGDKLLDMESFDYFIHMVTGQLFREEAVVEMLSSLSRRAEEGAIPANSKIVMRVQQRFEQKSV